MNRHSKLSRALTAAVLAAAFAGSGFTTVGTALQLSAAGPVWLMAALAAGICALAAGLGGGGLLGFAGIAALLGGYSVTHVSGLRAIRALVGSWQGRQVEAAAVPLGAHTLLVLCALIFGALYFLMLYHRGFTGMAVMLLSASLIFSHGMSSAASIPAAVPGLIAGAAAFALSDGIQRDLAFLRVLVPSALAVSLALLLLPGTRVTWDPLESLANRVRSVFEQYFNFTHERIAFSISEEGYNFGGEINGQPVAMLGGPANPDPNPVMRVTGERPMLLRGTIRTTYTGYSWVDVTPKSRYLYYDLTHRAVRDRVFDLQFKSPGDAFSEVSGQVELIDSGTSTLFVPGRMSDFDMDLSIAVYYNSSGEMFMARQAEPGDIYEVTTLAPQHGDALREAVLAAEGENDPQYDAVYAANLQLPEGIEEGLYSLTLKVAGTSESAYDRAEAIAAYLRRNMRYSLEVEYPPRGRDFASYFVLDAKQGYCSYFATAMAVMGRIVGLPTRYVEGYYARPGEDGTVTLTGADAHAWAEVYFKGLGWVPYDATNGGPSATGGQDAGGGVYGTGDTGEDWGDSEESPFDDPNQTIDGENDGDIADTEGGAPEDEDETEDTPEDESPEDNPEDNPEENPEDNSEEDSEASPDDPPPEGDEGEDDSSGLSFPWWLIALLLLLLLAAAAALIYRRLRQTDLTWLCGQSRRAQTSAMMIYRATLTLLSHMGQVQQGGETPEAFVARVSEELQNPDYADFARAVTLNRYAGKPVRKDDVEVGLRAYRRFLHGMRRSERLRFTLTRLFRGLGDFESIP